MAEKPAGRCWITSASFPCFQVVLSEPWGVWRFFGENWKLSESMFFALLHISNAYLLIYYTLRTCHMLYVIMVCWGEVCFYVSMNVCLYSRFCFCLEGFWGQPRGWVSRLPEQPCWLYGLTAPRQHSPLPRRFDPSNNQLILRRLTSVIVRKLVFPSWHQPLTITKI